MTAAQRLAEAVALHQAGRLDEAAAIYAEVVEREPQNADAHQYLGLIALRRGDLDGAITWMGRAIALVPAAAPYHYNLGLALQRRGDEDGAIASYRRAVGLAPGLAEAHNNLGSLLRQRGDAAAAADSYRRAIQARLSYLDAYINLSGVLTELGRLEDAETFARRGASLVPNVAEAHQQLGDILQRREKFAEAMSAYQRAVALKPESAQMHLGLGNALQGLGRVDEAVEAFGRALELQPDNAYAANGMGNAWLARGDGDRALDWYRKAVNLNAGLGPAWRNLGMVLLQHGQLAEAEAALRRAVELQPDDASAAAEMSAVLVRQWKTDEAVAYARQAAAAEPGQPALQVRLGVVLRARYDHNVARGLPAEISDFQEAEAALRKALSLDASHRPALVPLVEILKRQHRLVEAETICRQALAITPDFTEALTALADILVTMGKADAALVPVEEARRLKPDDPGIHRELLLYCELAEGVDAARVLREAEAWQARFAAALAQAARPPVNTRSPDRKLRVGYLAGTLFKRSSMSLGMLPVVEHHDRERFEVFCYSDIPAAFEDVFSRKFAAASVWRQCETLSDAELADLVRRDEIDILVDCIQFFPGTRMLALARRPAPVQIAFPLNATIGGVSVDYVIADPHIVPPEAERFFAEAVLHVPIAHCYQPLEDPPAVIARPRSDTGEVVFGSFNWLSKISPGTIAAWARILAAVPKARLLVKCIALHDQRLAQDFLEQFGKQGVDPRRIEIRSWTRTYHDHMATFGEVDVVLDTFPYNGVTITCDALWMGVPVITLAGERVLGRYGMALLRSVGFDEGVAETVDAYVAAAQRLAADPTRLAALRSELSARFRGSAVCDGRAVARSLENAYRAAWVEWCAAGATP